MNIIPFPTTLRSPVAPVVPAKPAERVFTPSEQAIRSRVIETVSKYDRNATIAAIRDAMKSRTGRTWSVTGGRGTAYGWLQVTAPPARRTWQNIKKPGTLGECREDYELKNTGAKGCYMSPEDQAEIERTFGDKCLDYHSIPASHAHYRVALAKALTGGDALGFTAEAYWD